LRAPESAEMRHAVGARTNIGSAQVACLRHITNGLPNLAGGDLETSHVSGRFEINLPSTADDFPANVL
jgi:hypothetical protein